MKYRYAKVNKNRIAIQNKIQRNQELNQIFHIGLEFMMFSFVIINFKSSSLT